MFKKLFLTLILGVILYGNLTLVSDDSHNNEENPVVTTMGDEDGDIPYGW